MPLDIHKLLDPADQHYAQLFDAHVNPQFGKVLRTIGFDRCYTRAEGAWLWDTEGNRYLDMIGGYGVFGVGRNHPEIRQALVDFMQAEFPSLVQLDPPYLVGKLAEVLKARIPYALDKVYFCNSGTEGIEAAIKFARCATGRPAILHCHKAFHGLTNGSLALNGDETFRAGFGPFLPECRAIPFNDLDALEQALRAGDVAAFVVEPVQGKGVNLPAPGYLKGAADLCHRYGALFVADEVQTGLGRTGRFLALEHHDGVDPDIVVLSKALSGGYVPIGAVLSKQWIYDRVFSSMERAVVHSSTFGKNALGMVAGLATLTCLEEHGLIERAGTMGDRLGQGLRELADRFEFIKEVRWSGLMLAIEFGKPDSLRLRTAWNMAHRLDSSLFPQAVVIPLLDDHHIITQVAGHHVDIIKLLPPFVIDDDDVQWFLDAFEQVMVGLHRFPGPVWEVVARVGKFALKSTGQRMVSGGG